MSGGRPAAGAWWRIPAVAGPGLIVMLADTDAGSVITAAQSGARWGYTLLLPQFVLVPLLFMVQELAARVGIGTGCGLAALVRRRYGPAGAAALLATLVASCLGALVTELSGLAGVAESLGLPVASCIAAAVALVLAIVWAGSYRSVERIALAIGVGELAFLALAWRAHPDAAQMAREALRLPLGDRSYLYLLAANIGTSVMPWTVFYQQSASLDKGLRPADLPSVRRETLAGAVLCQAVTAAVLVAAAAKLGDPAGSRPLETVGQIADAFTASLGHVAGHVVFTVGLGGGALVATIVVCLATGWAVSEALGLPGSLDDGPQRAPWLYGALTAALLAAAALVLSGTDLVRLSVAAGVLNALLLPVVLGALWLAARTALPAGLRPRGAAAAATAVVFALAAAIGLASGLIGAL